MGKRLICLLVLLTALVQARAQDRQQLQKEIEKIIYYDTNIQLEKNPGYVIGVIIGDSTYVYSYGSVTKDSVQLPDEHTLFEIGGMTKVFTAALVDQLVGEGLLQYDSTLNHYLPAAYRNPDCASITLRQLVHHSSGLPRMPLEFGSLEKEDNNPYAHYSKRNLLDFYKDYLGPTGVDQYLYSNLGYALLEQAIEQTTQKEFERVLQAKILQPLGLRETAVALSADQKLRLARGYANSGKPTQPWVFPSFAASEGLKSSVADLLIFLRANLSSQAALDFQALHQIGLPTGITPDSYAAIGWHVIKMRKRPEVVLHPGSTSGYRSFMGFVKETQTAVVVLSNSEYGTGGLGQLVLRMLNQGRKKKRRYRN
ncbi:MAG: serine hydrolase domain-containing protein [Bacteroidota bacterium]